VSDDATPRLGLPYVAAGQAQKHVTVNEAFARLDGLVQTAVESRATAAEPADPDDGALYILPADPTGETWGDHAQDDLMRFEAGGWSKLDAAPGHIAWIRDEETLVVFDGAAWIEIETDGGETVSFQNIPLLGLGATADAANPLTAKLNKVLLTAKAAGEGGDGDLRVTVNKETAGDIA
jgi:hypothetical protein